MGISDKLFRIAELSPGAMKMELLRLAEEQAKEERSRMLHCERQRRYHRVKRQNDAAQNVRMTLRQNDGERQNDASNVRMTNGIDLTHENAKSVNSVILTNSVDLTQENGVSVTFSKNEDIYSKRVIGRKKVSKKDYTSDFETFWNLYPRKAAKPDAFKAFSRAMKEKVPLETIVTGLKKFTFSDEVQYVPLPATWLNKRRWEDQPSSDYRLPTASPSYDVRKHLA